MIFNKTCRFRSNLSASEIRQRLLNRQFNVKGLDFEVYDKEEKMKIIPHAEDVEGIKTLPITHVDIKDEGNGASVRVFSKPRRIDAGGPYMVVIFCVFAVGASLLFYLMKRPAGFIPFVAASGAALFILLIMWWRMQSGYFNYVRNIQKFVKAEVA